MVSSRTSFTGDASTGLSAGAMLSALPEASAPLLRVSVTFAGGA
jgi:hypothetical protein